MRGGICRGFQGEGVDAFAATGVVDVAERDEGVSMCVDRQAGLLAGFAARGVRERLPFVRQPFGDAPRGMAVVIARRVDQEDLKAVALAPIQE